MTQPTPSLPRINEIPPPAASETKLIAEALHGDVVVPVPSPGLGGPPLDDDWPTLSVLSKRYIHRALAHTGGNKTRAADLLGIDRRTLNRILARERARRAESVKAVSR